MQYPLIHDEVRIPWNKGKITGQKPPLKRNEIWAVRVRLQIRGRIRDLALFNLAIDSKLRACDLVCLRVIDVTQGKQVASRAVIMQRKTKRPVQFEIADQSRSAIGKLIALSGLGPQDYLFPSRKNPTTHISTRQYAKLLKGWVAEGDHACTRAKLRELYGRWYVS
jgi:site-specific recombinase XerC